MELRHGEKGQALDVGRRTRTLPPALRRALEARDRGCRFPGCGVRRAQGHHIHHWATGGPTRLDNLALLCGRHHRAVHEDGYTVVRDTDGRLSFSNPRGRPIPEVPAQPAVPPDAAPTLMATNRAHGLVIHPRTGLPNWCGERLDLGWAISVLHPRPTRLRTGPRASDKERPTSHQLWYFDRQEYDLVIQFPADEWVPWINRLLQKSVREERKDVWPHAGLMPLHRARGGVV